MVQAQLGNCANQSKTTWTVKFNTHIYLIGVLHIWSKISFTQYGQHDNLWKPNTIRSLLVDLPKSGLKGSPWKDLTSTAMYAFL